MKIEHSTIPVLLVFALALLLRYGFSHLLPLNLDEVYSGPGISTHTFTDAANPFSKLNRTEPHPTLHYASMWIWMHTGAPLLQQAGVPEEGAVRGLAVLFGALAAALLAAAGFKVRPAAGWLAGLIAALGSYPVFMAEEARMYSLMEFGSALMLLLWVSFTLRGTFTLRQQACWVAASFLLMQSHYNAIPLAILYWLALALTLPQHRFKLLADGAILALLYLPWLLALFIKMQGESAGDGQLQASTGLILPYTIYAFSGGETLYHFGSKAEVLTRLPLILAVMVPAAVASAIAIPALRRAGKIEQRMIIGTLLIAALFLVFLWLGSFIIPKLFRSVRYAVGALPLLLFALSVIAVEGWKMRSLRLPLAMAGLVWLAVNAKGIIAIAEKKAVDYTPWPEVVSCVRALAPDQVLIYISFMKNPLLHYGPELPVCGMEEATPDWEQLAGQCPALRQSRRIVLIISHPRRHGNEWIELAGRHFKLEKTASFPRADIYLGIKTPDINQNAPRSE